MRPKIVNRHLRELLDSMHFFLSRKKFRTSKKSVYNIISDLQENLNAHFNKCNLQLTKPGEQKALSNVDYNRRQAILYDL